MPDPLSARQQQLLKRLQGAQRWTAVLGVLLVLAGATYFGWAVRKFDPRGTPLDEPGFDIALTRPLLILYGRYDGRLSRIEPETSQERQLLFWLKRNSGFSGGVMVLGLRTFMATLAVLLGLATLAVVAERARLLRIVAQLREPVAPSTHPPS